MMFVMMTARRYFTPYWETCPQRVLPSADIATAKQHMLLKVKKQN